MKPYGVEGKMSPLKIVDMEREAALNTFDEPRSIFNLSWAPFFESVLKQGRVSSASLKGFCLHVVECELKQRDGI